MSDLTLIGLMILAALVVIRISQWRMIKWRRHATIARVKKIRTRKSYPRNIRPPSQEEDAWFQVNPKRMQ